MGNQLGGHGGQVYQLAKKLDRSVESLIDFSASVNPLGPPASVLKAMCEAVDRCRHYPDPSSEDLRLQLAHAHKVSAESILVGNGSVELIRILPQALGLRQSCVVGPTFSEFETSLRLAGVKYRRYMRYRISAMRHRLRSSTLFSRDGNLLPQGRRAGRAFGIMLCSFATRIVLPGGACLLRTFDR